MIFSDNFINTRDNFFNKIFNLDIDSLLTFLSVA